MKKLVSGMIIYSLTPPKETTPLHKLLEINSRRIKRLSALKIDALSIYDVQEEKGRTDEKRIYKFNPVLNPLRYSESLSQLTNVHQIVYLVAGKYTCEEIESIYRQNPDKTFVIVGPPSRNEEVKTTVKQALSIAKSYKNNSGAVVIGERHKVGRSEADNIFRKIEMGADFFVSQCIYNVELYKKLLLDYVKVSKARKIEMKPIIFTFSPIGDIKGLEFMKWLGVDIPEIFINNIKDEKDFLEYSVEYLKDIIKEIVEFCKELNIPYGLNFETVICKKGEILASIELANSISENFF